MREYGLVASSYSYQLKVIGDTHFQPPEVCRRKLDKFSKIDYPPKVDIFRYGFYMNSYSSFGSALWEMITRREPFYELEEISLLCRQVIEGNRPKIPEDTPNQYSDVIKKCWDQGIYIPSI